MRSSSTTGGTGHFVARDGGCVRIGRGAGVIAPYAHYAIQIALGSERGVRFRSNESDAWTEDDGANRSRRSSMRTAATVIANEFGRA